MLPELRPGAIFAERFELEAVAGSGGMGTIYRARELGSGRLVAIKILHAPREQSAERFLREAQLLSMLTHPNIVQYIEHGEFEGNLYIAMEWLEGEDLSDRLERQGFTIPEAISVITQCASALSVAHRAGFIHRDIKPSNIFLVQGDPSRIKLLDFGIARKLKRTEPQMTQVGILLGTPGYMAPEVIREQAVDASSDVFSLGSVFFECLTGKPAFDGDHALAILSKVLLEQAPILRELCAEASPALESLVERMLAKERKERPADADALLQELTAIASNESSWTSPRKISPRVLTESEQRLLSVILAGEVLLHSSKTLSNEEYRAYDAQLEETAKVYGGHVEKLLDGSRLVLLSGGGVINDQAVRAARCALAIHSLAPDVPLVLATGRGVISERSVIGEVIDRGARSLFHALPGRVYIDDITAGFIANRFVVGRDNHGHFMSNERDILDAPRPILGVKTSFWGRDNELTRLHDLITESVQRRETRSAIIIGEPGVGKSRLRYEFLLRSGDSHIVLFGAGDAARSGSPRWLLGDIIARACGILEGEPLAVRQKKLRAKLARYRGLAERAIPFLSELIRAPMEDHESDALRAARHDSILMGDQLRSALRTFFELECSRGPVLLVLEDLHAADRASLQLLDSLVKEPKRLSMSLLGFARPSLLDALPTFWGSRRETITLGPLSEEASESLIREVLGESSKGGSPIHPQKITALLERSGGNPFYLEELLRANITGEESQLPTTILGMVEARLAELPSEARRILRAGSVFGQSFWKGALAPLLGPDLKTRPVEAFLDEMVSKELLFRRGLGRFPRELEFGFTSALLRDASYATLLPQDKLLGHRLAAEWLVKRGESDPGVLAEHFARGGDGARAAQNYRRAAEHALEGNDFPRAVEFASSGLKYSESEELSSRLRLLLAEAHRWRGEMAPARELALQARKELSRGSGPWFRSLAEISLASGRLGDFESAVECAALALRTPASEGAALARQVCMCSIASLLMQTGRIPLADELLQEAMSLSRLFPDDLLVEGRLYSALALRAQLTGDLASAINAYERAANAHRGIANERNLIVISVNLGVVYTALGGFEQAESVLQDALNGAINLGLPQVEAYARLNMSLALLRQGRIDESTALAEQSRIEGQNRKDPRLEGSSCIVLSQLSQQTQELSRAEEEARSAATVLASAPPLRAEALSHLARVLLMQGRSTEALAAAQQASELLQAGVGSESGESIVRLALYEAQLANNEPGAAKTLQEARARLLQRAEQLQNDLWRESFLSRVPENARIMALSQ
jgi:serine/threonine protein kinase/tetratricopeptide (TPR) repeat protein